MTARTGSGLGCPGLRDCRTSPRAPYLLSVASDVPFLPGDLVEKLSQALAGQHADIAIASSPLGTHPTIGLWPVDLAERLEHDLIKTPIRRLDQ